MHFWRKQYFQTLKDVATEAFATPQWADYGSFCIDYERGLRREAFRILDRFIASLERAPFADRRQFVGFLLRRADGREGRHMLIPHPLYIRIIEPTLLEWTIVEPECSEPHVWLGGFDHLKRALELDTHNEDARRNLIHLILATVSHATHELPTHYIGSPSSDLASLHEAEVLSQLLLDHSERDELLAEIDQERKLIEDFLRRGPIA